MNMHAVKSKLGFQCPFCKGLIQEDTARFGGNCPHCMLEIPGDEAPTDPGAILRIKKENEEKQRRAYQRRRNLVIGVGAAMFMTLVSAVGAWQYRVYQDSLVYELEDYYQTPIDQIAAHQPKVAEPEAPVAAVPGTPIKRTPRTTGGGTATGGTGTAAPEATGAPTATGTAGDGIVDETVGMTSTGARSSGGGDPFASLGPSRAAPIDDNAAIGAMLSRVMPAYQPRIDTCATQQLKQDENFTGSWQVKFVIDPNGSMKTADITAKGKPNAEFEACLHRNLMKMRFERITHDFTAKKTFNY